MESPNKISLLEITLEEKGVRKTCGIEYKKGKFSLYGRQYMDRGAVIFMGVLAKEAKSFISLLVKEELKRKKKT